MDNNIIQAYLWNEIIRIGFSPTSDKDKKTWLHLYGKNLKKFWEIEEYPITLKANLIVIFHSKVNLEYRFNRITNLEKYTIELIYLSNPLELIWTHDVDSQGFFLFPENSLLNKYNKLRKAKRNISSIHIEKVLDGLIFHPAVHQHIQSPIDNHDIRIGGGIYNPFVFLFNLRYQLCPNNEIRNQEKTRLVTLFEDAIKNNRNIPPNELFG